MMNNFTPFPLASYWSKKAGAILVLIALLFLLLVTLFKGMQTLIPLDQRHLLEIGGWALAFGLVGIVTSKERIDDERVQKIRASAYRMSFTLIFIVLATFGGSNMVEPGKISIDPLAAILFIALTYDIIFYIGLYSGSGLYYADDDALENFRKNRRFVTIYVLIVGLLGLLVLIAIKNAYA